MAIDQLSRLAQLAQEAAGGQIDIAAATAAMIRQGAAVEADPYVMIGLLIEGIVHTTSNAIPAERRDDIMAAALQMLADRFRMLRQDGAG